MCGGPLRAARAEEGNPRPGLSLSGSASLLRLEASGLSRSGRAGGDLSLIPYPTALVFPLYKATGGDGVCEPARRGGLTLLLPASCMQ